MPMALDQELLSLEKQFWTQGKDFYRKKLDERCLVAFTEMAGVMSKEQVVSTIDDQKRFRDIDIEQKGLLQPDDDVAVLTYRVKAQRPDGERYQAVVSSGYARRNGEWKMV